LNIESFRNYCIQKKGVTEELPFGPDTLVFKVMGKMFALTNLDLFTSINLKCDPEEAVRLREAHPSILPGYHMSKKHWNTILMDSSLNDKMIMKLIDDSYELVVAGLPKKDKRALQELE
jgi:predicted DNA-binding protein (MmcQ/YjbR family)